MDKDQEFHFEIHFENLWDWELGLLIFALRLEKGLAHKPGMGKPLGFSSVEIQVKGLVSDSENPMKEIRKAVQDKFKAIWEKDTENIPEKLFQLLCYAEKKNIIVKYPALNTEEFDKKDLPGYMEFKEGGIQRGRPAGKTPDALAILAQDEFITSDFEKFY